MTRVFSSLRSYAFRFAYAHGRVRNVQGFVLGLLAAATLPPLHLVPLLWAAYGGLLLLVLHAPNPRRAFFDGWWFGLGYFLAGCYWIAISLFVDAARFAWLLPFPTLGLSAILGIYTGLVCLATFHLPCRGVWKLAGFAALWVIGEWLRGHLFSGFPWNSSGLGWTLFPAAIQNAAWWGMYGMSGLAVFVAAAPALLAGNTPEESREGLLAVGVTLALFGLIAADGAVRLHEARESYVEGIHLRLVQPNTEQSLKWDPRAAAESVQRQMALTTMPGFEQVTHVIWSETAMPFPLDPASPWLQIVAGLAPRGGLFITGAVRAERGPKGELLLWNSIAAIDRSGAIVASYDKNHLVPFGEFVPLRHYLPVERFVPGPDDFQRGKGTLTLHPPHTPPFSPLICYEAVFPAEAADKHDRPSWLLNLTNDAWFGRSSGPYQHLEQARLRAVEQGLPLVRAAGGGISAVITPYGRTVAQLGLGKRGILDSGLPSGLEQPTLYAKYGDLMLGVWLGLISITAGLIRLLHKITFS